MSRTGGARSIRPLVAVLIALPIVFIQPLAAAAHAGIVERSPDSNATVPPGNTQIVAVFSEELDPSSSFVVVDSQGDQVGGIQGELDLDDLDHTTMRAEAELAPGTYEVAWTSVSAEDGDAEEGSWTFSVVGAGASGEETAIDPTQESESSNAATWLVVLGVVIVAAAIGLVMVRRSTVRASVTTLMILTAALVFGASLPALAHGTMVASDPEEGSAIDESPDQLRIWISEPVSPRFSSVELQRLDGQDVPIDGLEVDTDDGQGLLVVDLPELEDGTYSAAWTVLSESDGHITRGLVVFGVGSETVARATTALPAEPLPWLEAVAKWAGLFALMAVVGAVALAQLVLKRQPQGEWSRPLLRTCVVGSVVGATAGVGSLLIQAHQLLETLPNGSKLLDVALQVIGTTNWGRLWLVREILFLSMTVLALVALRGTHPRIGKTPVVLASMLVITQALTSHAAGSADQVVLAVTVDSLHLAAASVWIGGLATMMLIRRSLVIVPWRRFGGMAAISVGLLLATGLFSTGLQVPSVRAAISSAYGRTLIGKLALFGGVILFGALNATLVHPGLSRPIGRALGKPEGWTPISRRLFPRLLIGEVVVGVTVVAATGLLTSLSPPNGGAAVSNVSAVNAMSDVVDDVAITLNVQPNLPGDNVFVVHAASEVRPVVTPIERVLIRFEYMDEAVGKTTERMVEVEPGRFRLGGNQFARAGDWDVEVVVRRRGMPDASASFDWTVPPTAVSSADDRWNAALEPVTSLLAVIVLAVMAGAVSLWSVRRRHVDFAWEPTAIDITESSDTADPELEQRDMAEVKR